jgi:hypothetical protein
METSPGSPTGDPVKCWERELNWKDRAPIKERLPAYDPTKDKLCSLYNKPSAAILDTVKRPNKGDIRQAYRGDTAASAPGFASVAAALDFEHHVGSDPALELQVLKAVVLREGLLSQIEILVEELMRPEAYRGEAQDHQGLAAAVIELLAQVRDRSLEVVEAVEQWRDAMSPPPPFVWQNTNYLLKMCR